MEHSKQQICQILNDIIDTPKKFTYEKEENSYLYTILHLLELETDIISNLSDEIKTLLRDALLASTPPVEKFNPFDEDFLSYPTPEQNEELMKTIPLLTSPLIKVLPDYDRVMLEDALLRPIIRTIEDGGCVFPPSLPNNYFLLKQILDSSDLRERFELSGGRIDTIIAWALLNDRSLLFYFTAEELNTAVTPVTPTSASRALKQQLKEKHIDKELFLQLSNEIPDLSALVFWELLEDTTQPQY